MMPQYDDVERALRISGASGGGAECHGALCGMLTANVAAPMEPWLGLVLEETDPADALTQELRKLLESMYEASRRELQDPALDFNLLLPSDVYSLTERVDAMVEWCQGFLLGLSLGGLKADQSLPSDSAEVLHDLTEIAKSGFQVEEGEEDEAAYAEVTEYIRVGVLLIGEELQPFKAPPRLQ